MLHEVIHAILPELISLFELLGIIVIVIGAGKTIFNYCKTFFNKRMNYNVRIQLGNALSLGLEFKMGAEILRTVQIAKLEEIATLGAIIILRALLAFLIHWEISNEKKSHLDGQKETA
jgi:uncharacterized membrane protein